MRTLTPRERRLVALGLLVLALGLGWLGIVQPLIAGFFDRAAERQQLRMALQRDDRIAAALPLWRQAADAQRRSEARFAIFAPSEALAVENLKGRLEHVAADEGYALGPVEDLQADAPVGATRIRADMTLGLTQLTHTLRRLENEGAYVVVDYLSITADEALIVGRLSPLRVRLELTAAYRPSPPRSP